MKIYSSFILLPSLLSLLQVDAFLLNVFFLVSGLVLWYKLFQQNKNLTKMYNYTATEMPYIYVV